MKSIRHLVLLVAAFVCALAIGGAAAAQAASYYVNGGGGSDSNAGTEAKPFNTLTKAESVTKAGDVVYMKGTFGNTRFGNSSTGNGTSWNEGGYITYKIWGNSWVDMNGGYAGIQFVGKKYILVDGFYNGERRIRVYNKDVGFLLEQGTTNIKITGCIFNPAGYTSSRGHFATIICKGVEIYDNELYSAENCPDWNEILYFGQPGMIDIADDISVHDNTFYVRQTNAKEMQAIDCKALPGSKNIRVFRNTFISTANKGIGCIQVSGSMYFYDNYMDLSKATGDGAYAFFFDDHGNGAAAKFYAYRNTIVGASNGIVFPAADWTTCEAYIYNNVMMNTGGVIGKLYGGFKTLGLYHNTFYNSSASGFSYDTTASINVKNNIFYGWGTYALTDTSSEKSSWNGNIYYKSGASATTNAFQWNGSTTNFNSLKSSSGQEAQGQFGTKPNVDSKGLLLSALPSSFDASSEMSFLPDYNLDINSKVRTKPWDVGAVQAGSGSVTVIQPPTGLRVVGN